MRLSLVLWSAHLAAGQAGAGAQPRVDATLGSLPLYFIENQGQLDGRVAYYLSGRDTSVYFTEGGITFGVLSQRERWVVRLDFVDGNAEPLAEDRTPAIVSYFKGPPSQWHTGLPTFARVRYRDIWPGIDLVYSGTEGRLKYTFVVQPGADPKAIRLRYTGASNVTLTTDGRLRVSTPVGSFEDDTPFVYQDIDGSRVEVDSAFLLEGSTFGFRLGTYDRTRELILDPVVLAYCGFIGGSSADEGEGVAVDAFGNAYVVGGTSSSEASFPETVGPDLTFGGGFFQDGFIAKVDAGGTGLVYAGYIGGSEGDNAQAVAVDSDGNAYVAGDTASNETTFPVTPGSFDDFFNGGTDGFLVKINAAGTGFVYGGYIGGTGTDEAHGVAIDGSGNAYVTGETDSTEAQNFPLAGGLDNTFNGGARDGFVTKVNAAGDGFVYSGYLGGSGADIAQDIAVDGFDAAYVTGQTAGLGFPTAVGPATSFGGGTFDGFITKVNPSGGALDYSGFVGGSGNEDARGVAVDSSGAAYVTGWTTSSEVSFPVAVGPNLVYSGSTDAYVAKIAADGSGFDYAGYIGGSSTESGEAVAVDGWGGAVVAGIASSTEAQGFPVLDGPDLTHNGGDDAFVAKVRVDGTGLVYNGYIGGSGNDFGNAVAVDPTGRNAFVAGETDSTEANFPETVGPDLTANGGSDAFVANVEDRSVAVVNLRSIGTRADDTAGTVSATFGDTLITGSGTSWQANNRGRGDRIDIDGTDYTVLAVLSDSELVLTEPFGEATASGLSYAISRQYPSPDAWEDCIDGGPCTFFPTSVSSSSLVADNRSEVGIVYDDSVYAGPVDGVVLRINGPITDAQHTITVTADGDNRHYGIAGAGARLQHGGGTSGDGIEVRSRWVTIEWIEVFGDAAGADGIEVSDTATAGTVILRNNLVHDVGGGIQIQDALVDVDVYNNIIYDTVKEGIVIDQELVGARILNNTVFNTTDEGIRANAIGDPYPEVLLRNNIVYTTTAADYAVNGPDPGTSNNISEDGTAPGGSSYTGVCLSGAGCLNFVSATDLHLQGTSFAIDKAADLSGTFTHDIDRGVRADPWDIGADEAAATTAVELVSFEAAPADEAIALTWRTASELNNLGFHVYRSTSREGPFDRLTERPIPGLGSSPAGATYEYRDEGLVNGAIYFYVLEDVETTGETERHGPVSASPLASAAPPPRDAVPATRITYGEPGKSELRVLKRNRRGVVLELTTNGFYAEPQDDGSVRVSIPGFGAYSEAGSAPVPVKRTWIEAIAGRKVRLTSVRAKNVEVIEGLRPSDEAIDVVATTAGTVRAQRRLRRLVTSPGLHPNLAARLLSVGFHGGTKKALVELAPMRWDADSGRFLLARKLVVRLSFRGREPSEARRVRRRDSAPFARFVTTEKGLHRVPFEAIFSRRARGVPVKRLRLSRQGESVPFYVEPVSRRFRRGSTLYFVSEGGDINPFGHEAVYELEIGSEGVMIGDLSAAPGGEPVPYFWTELAREENRIYQAGLVDAPDVWLWDVLFAPEAKAFSFDLERLAPSSRSSTVTVWLQGTTDTPASPDHHVRLFVNGTFVGEEAWDGKTAVEISAAVPAGVLRERENALQIENVGDTKAALSMVMLDRFQVRYPSALPSGVGTADVSGVAPELESISFVLDVTGTTPKKLTSTENHRFRVEAGHSYLMADREAMPRPAIRRPFYPVLTRRGAGADYVVIGPQEFLLAVRPLLSHRARQGLRVMAVSTERIYSEFGHGETTPAAIQAFLAYAYHNWRRPALRYVLLVGDGTYDYKDYLQTGVENRVPPLMVRTSHLWTSSDSTFASVHGEDALPDLAIGRLPAATMEDVRTMVRKILAYETRAASETSVRAVLVADDRDAGGDFERDADAIASTFLNPGSTRKVYLSRVDAHTARAEILAALDDGASMFSYLGHGGIHLWADENVFNIHDIASLSPQSHQPILLTMNCLNGYFHFPFFDSLAEAMVKADGRGAIAALSPSGLSLNDAANRYHRALLSQILSGSHERLGDAILAAQVDYLATGQLPELLTIYHLFGDPALQLE